MTKMKFKTSSLLANLIACAAVVPLMAVAGVSSQEAQQLKSTLTPMGAEKAGNKDGSIPAWAGGSLKVPDGYKAGQRRADQFPGEKPLYTVTAKNIDQYADKLTDGQKEMLKKYPTYRLNVFPTHRTALAPQSVYDNTFKNATNAKLVPGSSYDVPSGAFGGVPFPIPKSGVEVVWNHLLHYQGVATRVTNGQTWMVTADGKKVLTVEGKQEIKMPYFDPKGSAEKFDGTYWFTRVVNVGPAIRAGEAIVGRVNVDEAKTNAWVYLTGQRRVRKLPNPAGDTPTPTSAGVMSFDEVNVFASQPGLFNWKLVGKKEMLIPYNNSKPFEALKAEDLMEDRHLNPDHIRWELHRVWVVDAELAPGKRHTAPKGRYYFDEDSWLAVLGDRWDAKGQLWKTLFGLPVVYPEMSLTDHALYGFYDLISGTWFAGPFVNKPAPMMGLQPVSDLKDEFFTPDAMVGDQLR
jgi:hypothetical protein